MSLGAMRWCSRVGTPLVVVGLDGAVLTAGPPGRDDARLLRAQALALYGPAGIAVTRYLIGAKLHGQAQVLRLHLGEDDAASTLVDLCAAVEEADSIEAIRQLEAAGANVYRAAFERRVEVTFARKDVPKVPAHWCRFNGRRSSINPGSPRSATDVAGAVLNYGYKLAEIEAGLAAGRMGLHPGIGILHADAAGRPSFACGRWSMPTCSMCSPGRCARESLSKMLVGSFAVWPRSPIDSRRQCPPTPWLWAQ